MSGLFLLSPEIDMKLIGKTMRGAFVDQGKESLFKRIERLKHEEDQAAAKGVLTELLAVLPGTPIETVFAAAIDGDGDAMSYLASLGMWESCLYDRWARPNGGLNPQGFFILEIERACKDTEQLVREAKFELAAQAISTHPLLRLCVWPQALEIITSAETSAALLPLKVSVAFEIRLSLVALVDVTAAQVTGTPSASIFGCLLPSSELSGNPTSLFFRWLKDEVGAQTIEALLDKDASGNGGIADVTTLKRWSNGSHQPSKRLVRELAKEYFGNSDDEWLWDMYWASRYLNFIGYYVEMLCGRVLSMVPEKQHEFAPWPHLPFDCDSIPTMCLFNFDPMSLQAGNFVSDALQLASKHCWLVCQPFDVRARARTHQASLIRKKPRRPIRQSSASCLSSAKFPLSTVLQWWARLRPFRPFSAGGFGARHGCVRKP